MTWGQFDQLVPSAYRNQLIEAYKLRASVLEHRIVPYASHVIQVGFLLDEQNSKEHATSIVAFFTRHLQKLTDLSALTMFRIIFCCCLFLVSCGSSRDVQLLVGQSRPDADGSIEIKMSTYIGKDTIEFGNARILRKQLDFLSASADSLSLEVWHPVGAGSFDTSNLILLIPGYNNLAFSLYSLALEASRSGNVVGIVHPRGVGLNSGNAPDFRTQETQDLVLAMNAYETRYGSPISVAIFGHSVGGVTALNLLTKESRVKRAVFESIMSDPIQLSAKVLTTSDYEALQRYIASNRIDTTNIKPYHILGATQIAKPMLFVWGASDELIPIQEREYLKSLAKQRGSNVEYLEVQGGHVLRYGFPLSASAARKLNADIIAFLGRY